MHDDPDRLPPEYEYEFEQNWRGIKKAMQLSPLDFIIGMKDEPLNGSHRESSVNAGPGKSRSFGLTSWMLMHSR